MEKGTVSIYFVQSAVAPVVARGLDCDAILRTAGIAPSLLQSPQSRVTAHNFSALWLEVARQLDDELFGQDARRMKVGSFAMLCQMLVHYPTLGKALDAMCRFFNLLLDDFRSGLETGGGDAALIIGEQPGKPARIFGHETLLMMQLGLACWLAGRRIPVLETGFAYPRPEHGAEYQLMFSRMLAFDRTASSIRFSRACLDLPVVQNERTAREFVRTAPANIVLKYKNSRGIASQIRRSLRGLQGAEWPDFEALARRLNMTESTLRRRLHDEGQSYQAIKDDLRRDMAMDYLCHTGKSITDIAVELGFAEASAFYRAFRKWTGAAPGEYRNASHKR